MESYVTLLSLIVFLPTAGALALAFFPRTSTEGMKQFSLLITAVVFALTVIMALPQQGTWQFDPAVAQMQKVFSIPWIPDFNINYYMGVDGISFPLVLLTTFVTMLSMAASWPIDKHVKAYCILFLLLETGMLGVFMALDFFLFYVFWEVMLLPMYFLIGVWGGPRREYAAIKFFLYTLLGSVFMLIAILILYFNSDVKQLTDQQLVASNVVSGTLSAEAQAEAIKAIRDEPGAVRTFNIVAMQELGQHTRLFDGELWMGKSLQWWAFLFLLIGFVIKVPSVPLHTWLPDAHVEAPTPISMILAGVLLKMGGYGIIRICYPICPDAGYDLAYFVCALGVVSMVYGGFAALAQKDFKRLVAYSSVSHMGYVVLGIGVWSAVAGNQYNSDYWKMGVNGAMFQMIAHGISSPAMFFMVGVIYERVHHRNLDHFGGLFAKMPVYSGLAIGIFFAGLGLPGLCGFIGEVLVTFSVWNYSAALAVVSASVVIITAAYILWTLQRVYLGPEYKGPHADHLHPMTFRELAIAAPLLALAILFGVYPNAIFRYMTPSVNMEVDDLVEWTRDVKTPRLTETAAREAGESVAAHSGAIKDQAINQPANRTVNFSELLQNLIKDTLASTAGFQAELVICATIVLLLLLRIPRLTSRIDAFYIMLAGSAVALYLAGPWHTVDTRSELFTGLLVYDSFTVYFRTLLLFFAVLFAIFTRISGVPDNDAAPDIYALVLGATLGMCIMASANHLLMVFLGVEMASVPSYALAGMLKGRRQSSEAALKYAVYGAGAAGIMLYGISLLAGVLGSVHLPTMAVRLAELLQPANLEQHIGTDTHMVLALGGLMMLVGVAFKLSAVPFHFWCPDVFEGASAEVDAFLSIASKAAALALLVRLAIGFGYIPAPAAPQAEKAAASSATPTRLTAAAASSRDVPVRLASVEKPAEPAAPLDREAQNQALAPARDFIWKALVFLAAITCTFGNLAAYGQTNIKRLLAYSTIAQAGYMIMPVPAAMVLADTNPEAAKGAIGAMAFYAGVYIFMNLGAFAVVAFLRNMLHSEEIADYAGLIRRAPVVVVCFVVILVSLVGIPPLAGFVGKLLIFYYLVEAKLWALLVIAGLNTAISLYYYLRVVKVMTMDPEPENRLPATMSFLPGTFVVAVTLPLFILFLGWSNLNTLALAAARHLF